MPETADPATAKLLIAIGCGLFAAAAVVLSGAAGRIGDVATELRQTRGAFLRAIGRDSADGDA